ASSALAANVVAGAGPSLVDSIDLKLKNDFGSGGGSFYNGVGYPGPNPTWKGTAPVGSDPAPVEQDISPASFRDIAASPFRGDVLWLLDAGITRGCTTKRFCPEASVTREQMASFLVRALRLPATTRDFFRDDSASPHEGDINRLAASGITGGCGGGRFCPREVVTREQMASFIARAWRLPSSPRNFFTDDRRSDHNADIDRLAAAGITGGCDTTLFCPGGRVTRGQMAAFLHRALSR
ncbi:MAG: S-layer homology domain-containing protein, partial [Chloroflexota bacterium]